METTHLDHFQKQAIPFPSRQAPAHLVLAVAGAPAAEGPATVASLVTHCDPDKLRWVWKWDLYTPVYGNVQRNTMVGLLDFRGTLFSDKPPHLLLFLLRNVLSVGRGALLHLHVPVK